MEEGFYYPWIMYFCVGILFASFEKLVIYYKERTRRAVPLLHKRLVGVTAAGRLFLSLLAMIGLICVDSFTLKIQYRGGPRPQGTAGI